MREKLIIIVMTVVIALIAMLNFDFGRQEYIGLREKDIRVVANHYYLNEEITFT